MKATTRLTQEQIKAIISEHYKAKGIRVESARIGREDYGGDPREQSYGYVELTLEIPDP